MQASALVALQQHIVKAGSDLVRGRLMKFLATCTRLVLTLVVAMTSPPMLPSDKLFGHAGTTGVRKYPQGLELYDCIVVIYYCYYWMIVND